MTIGKLTYTLPDGRTEERLFDAEDVLKVGRAQDNDVVLPDPSVADYHAVLRFEGAKKELEDLGTGPTALDNRPMTKCEKATLLGRHTLKLGAIQVIVQLWQARPPSAPQPGEGALSLALDRQPGAVLPGATVSVQAYLQYAPIGGPGGPDASARFDVSVTGMASAWAQCTPRTVDVRPERRGVVSVLFRPPRSPAPRAGAYPFAVVVASSTGDAPQEVSACDLLEVAPIVDTHVALDPQPARRAMTVSVANRGNTTCVYEVAVLHLGRTFDVSYDIDQPIMVVPPGATRSTRIGVGVLNRRRIGSVENEDFIVSVRPHEDAASAIHQNHGRIEIAPLIPAWLAATAVIVALTLAGALWAVW